MRSRLLIALFTAVAGFACAACQQLEDVPASDPTEAHATSTATPPDVAAPASADAAPTGSPAPADRVEPSHVMVFYFHRTIRCETCLKFEALTERALRDAFADELASGRLVWQVMDFEEPGNEPLTSKYGIFESSVVALKLAGESEVEWKKLDAIWTLVGDEGAFMDYIESEVSAYLAGGQHGQ